MDGLDGIFCVGSYYAKEEVIHFWCDDPGRLIVTSGFLSIVREDNNLVLQNYI